LELVLRQGIQFRTVEGDRTAVGHKVIGNFDVKEDGLRGRSVVFC
jgi:hypothetical protein